ncbi:BamA/TamA family outer membrane protein [Erythrobacter cryptus]|uniref:BamA/TamA family outer membrane protein n=1 Tax=Erythrobacter cryptus TaxID=196588 RepID=UPI000A070969|nr:BamA/TamA family outer membrane protein [Erythrobacter cryptus]
MASLSSFRPADIRCPVFLALAIAAGLAPTPAEAAQAGALAAQSADAPASVPPEAPGEGADDAAPEPAPVPDTLEALIPPEALADPEGWAARAVSGVAGADAVPEAAPDGADPLAGVVPPPPAGLEGAVDAAFADFALDLPEPLPPDPEADQQARAVLAAPVLEALPELAEAQIGPALVLGLPAAESFPERAEFITRFRALSRLEALDDKADAAPQIAARARADEELLGDLLRTYGYYDGAVIRQLSGGRRDGDAGGVDSAAAEEPQVRFDVIPGTRYRFGRIDLGGLGTLAEPDASRLRAAFAIQPGDPLHADRILERELELRVALGESGYPFAALAEPELTIDHARAEGDLVLPVSPGGKYVFGPVESGDPGFLPSRHLERIARFRPGEVFRQSMATDLRRAIIATGLVSSVTVTPRESCPPQGDQPGEVALDVALERAPLRTIAGAIGYGTEDGFKLEGRWEHRNLFPPEGALRLRGILGTREALASIGVRRNNFRGRDQVLSADLYASDITTLAVDSRGFGLRGAFEKVSNLLFQKPVSFQLGGELISTDERNRRVRIAPGAPEPRRTFLIGGLFGSLTLDASDNLLDPTTGYRATLFLAPEVSRSQGQDRAYLRAQADAAYYHSFGGTVLAARVRAATIEGAAAADIAPSRRLYAGGGGSVRGYGFQGVGPRDSLGNPIGGASLVEAAAEARIDTPLFGGALEVVPFIDAGTVARGATPDFGEIRAGAGIGIRYKTSFGPVRVDVATPLNPTRFDSPVVVYVSLGQAF